MRERRRDKVIDSSEIDSQSDGGELNQGQGLSTAFYHLDKFRLFETPSDFYLVGRDKAKIHWRVLKIGRSEATKLVIDEDPTIYSHHGYKLFLQDKNVENKLTGGPNFVTICYGIVGFIRFSGPYYIILITERREIGDICGHPIYAVSEYKMIPIPHSTVWYMDNHEKENRYNKCLGLVDITKDFFFSYSYPIMHKLQENLCHKETRQLSDRTMFVWNEYLTHQIRNHLKTTLWTVALVHGFFKQVKLSHYGKSFILTLIARRSRQFAGTRYQRRGVNEKGQAANDVEIEQIVWQEIVGDCPYNIAAVVQNRGSIPLCWSQEPSLLNFRPDIIFSEDDNRYEATQLHFQELRLRYGDPIIAFNLVKKKEKKPRESLLHDEYLKAVDSVNEKCCEEVPLKVWSLDLDAHFRREGIEVLKKLKGYAASALNQIGFFSCQIPQAVMFEASFDLSYLWMNGNCNSQESKCSDSNNSKHQKGILRANCLDSLDRTNVAQHVYSLVALGHQLYDLKIIEFPELDFNQTLAKDVMSLYEDLGNALSQQYGGSEAKTKIFSKLRGQWKVATRFHEFMKSIQRHYSNSFKDEDKQKAIDTFLGNLKPEVGHSAQLNTNLEQQQSTEVGESPEYSEYVSWSLLKRPQSDSNIRYKRYTDMGEDIDSSEISRSGNALTNPRPTTPHVPSPQLLCYLESHWYGGVCTYCNEEADEVGSSNRIGSSGS